MAESEQKRPPVPRGRSGYGVLVDHVRDHVGPVMGGGPGWQPDAIDEALDVLAAGFEGSEPRRASTLAGRVSQSVRRGRQAIERAAAGEPEPPVEPVEPSGEPGKGTAWDWELHAGHVAFLSRELASENITEDEYLAEVAESEAGATAGRW